MIWSPPCFEKPRSLEKYVKITVQIIFPVRKSTNSHMAVDPPAAEKTRDPVEICCSFGSRSSCWVEQKF